MKVGAYVPGPIDKQVGYHDDFAEWLGMPLDLALHFAGSAKWTTIASLFNYPATWKPWVLADTDREFHISVPLLPDEAARQWDHANLVPTHKKVVDKIVATGAPERMPVRLGWETNGSWQQPWAWQAAESYVENGVTKWRGTKNLNLLTSAAQGFARSWRKVAPLYLAARIPLIWCPAAWGTTGLKPGVHCTAWYPGDAYVSRIHMDRYNRVWPQDLDLARRWAKIKPDFDAMAAFAKQRGKPFGISEWANWQVSTNGSGDDPVYVRGVGEWAKASGASDLIWFNAKGGGVGLRMQDQPKTRAEFVRQFGPS
jgi:beta-mannanase